MDSKQRLGNAIHNITEALKPVKRTKRKANRVMMSDGTIYQISPSGPWLRMSDKPFEEKGTQHNNSARRRITKLMKQLSTK